MRWTIERGPAENQPVSLDIARRHLRLFVEDGAHPDDQLVATYINAATAWAEGFTRREIAQREVILYTDCLQDHYNLPVSPVNVISAEYLDEANDWRSLDFDADLSSDPPEAEVLSFPDDWKGGRNSVRFTVGAGYEELPADMLSGILLLIGHWYENRESVVIHHPANKIPLTTETILWPFRALDFER
jgi:uncharacterized phiE125 gp8 family phage protein